MICMAKKKAAIKRRESDFCISKDWFDDKRYDPYKHKRIAIHKTPVSYTHLTLPTKA